MSKDKGSFGPHNIRSTTMADVPGKLMTTYKVLVALDGSNLAEHSLIYLDALRLLADLDVRLVSVVDGFLHYDAAGVDETRARETHLLGAYLRDLSSDLEEYNGLNVE